MANKWVLSDSRSRAPWFDTHHAPDYDLDTLRVSVKKGEDFSPLTSQDLANATFRYP